MSILNPQDSSKNDNKRLNSMNIDGRFWFTKKGQNFLGNGRIELLEQVDKTGSISASAKAMKMSYKGAWERINQMNELADTPIITKVIGGKGGGGTILTPHARELIETFKSFEKLHRQFIKRFAEAGDDPERLARILGRTFLTTSARNQLVCTIEDIQEHGINGSIKLRLDTGEEFFSDITVTSIRNMGLTKGCDAYAIIKSSDVLICNTPPKNDETLNIFEGKIKNILSQENNVEITFALNNGGTLISVLSLEESLSLKKETHAFACVSKHNIILGL